MQRTSLNSAVLQKKFSEVYQEFFGKCSVVLSTSLSFSWIEDFAQRYRGISISQKMPFKTYVGLEMTDDNTVSFGDIYQYQPLTDGFEMNSLERSFYPILEIKDYVNRKMLRMGGQGFQGFKIHCLTELPASNGYSFFGNFSALVSALLFVMTGHLSEEDILQWAKFSPMELMKNKDLHFSDVFYTAWDINYILKYGDSPGSGPFASMITSYYPIITFPAKTIRSRDYNDLKYHRFAGLGKLPFWGYRLNDLYDDLESSPFWPIDMGVVFSGKPCISERVTQKVDNDYNQYQDFKSHFRDLFGKNVGNSPLLPDFYETCVLEDEAVVDKFYDLYGVLSLIMIRHLHSLLLHGYDEGEVEKFVATVSKKYFASLLMDESSLYMSEFLLKLNTGLLQGKSFSRVGFFNTNNIQLGGGVGFVTSPQLNRVNLMAVFDELSNSFPNMSVDYISWLDGYGESGVVVEQNLKTKKYSSFIDSSSFIMCTYQGRKMGKTIVSGARLKKIGKEYDILCNLIDNTILIGGLVISSSDLHSQKATLQFLSKLLSKRNEDISCKEFPRSSYTLNKNEMQGKIVLPLLKLVRARTHKDLGLTCKGSNTEFFLKLMLKDNQKIGVIKHFQ